MAKKINNPAEKLLSCIQQLDVTFKTIVENVDNPEVIKSLSDLKLSLSEDKKDGPNIESKEILKLLAKYPGLSKQALTFLRGKISEYKSLGVLDSYKGS